MFDDFCSKINQSYGSLEAAIDATGVDTQDVRTLVGSAGFDLSLLNYASYVRVVSSSKALSFLVLTSTAEHPSGVPDQPNCGTSKVVRPV